VLVTGVGVRVPPRAPPIKQAHAKKFCELFMNVGLLYFGDY